MCRKYSTLNYRQVLIQHNHRDTIILFVNTLLSQVRKHFTVSLLLECSYMIKIYTIRKLSII